MRNALALATLGAALLAAAGCNRAGRELGPLTPQAASRTEYRPATDVPGDDVNPVRTAQPAAPPSPPGPAEPTGTLTRPDQDATYQARLGDVALPIPRERVPVLADAAGPAGSPVLVNTVLAEVNGQVITRQDILGPLRPQLEAWRRQYSAEAFESRCREVVSMRLREAISQKLVIQEAERELAEDEKTQIDLALGKIIKDLTAQAGSVLLLEERLQAEGTTLSEERKRRREQLLVQQYLRSKIAPTVHITHSELLDAYRAVCAERYVVPTQTRLGLIAIKKTESPTPAEARALAEAVHQRAAAGEDFARLAQRYSHGPMAEQGGDWGFVTQGSFRVKVVDAVLFALPPGKVGPLVETDDAFYVVKALERREGRTIPFTEVQDEIEDELRDRKYNETVNRYIQDLYKRGYVRVMLDNL